MKKQYLNTLLLVTSIVLLSSCSPAIKLVNSWKSNEFTATKGKKILVVAKSKDIEVRKAYESTIVKELKRKNIEAIEAYKLFPNLNEDKKRSKEEIKEVLSLFNSKGIKAIMLTSLKDTKTITKCNRSKRY